MRIALTLSMLILLGLGAALYWGAGIPQVEAVRAGITTALAPAPPPVRPLPAPVQVQVAPVRVEDVAILLSGIGTVQAYNTVNVKSRVDGEVVQVLFREGQDVAAGDALAVIDPRPLQAQLAQAQASRAKDAAMLEGALLDLRRYEDLVQKNFASRQQLDQQRATVDQVRAQIQNDEAQIAYATTQLGFTTVRSPIAGRIGIRQIDQGNFVRASDGAVLTVVTQLQPISAVFSLPAGAVAAARLTPGQTSVKVAAYGADDRTKLDDGTVDFVDNQVDPATGTIKLKATFPNAEIRLWPGNFVNGRLVVDVRRGGLTVPEAAVRHGPLGDFVWIARPDGTAISRRAVVGQVASGRALVTQGLAKGDLVVTEGHFRLEDNAKIEVVRPDAPRTGAR